MSHRLNVKVFGERNSGTNFISAIISRNYNINLLSGTTALSEEKRNLIQQSNGIERLRFKEYLLDKDNENIRLEHFGWKHAVPNLEDIGLKRDLLDEYAFVCITKNPYAFVDSLYRRPYHLMARKPATLLEFVAGKWDTVVRDNVAAASLRSPVELWNLKVAGYFDLQRFAPRVCIIRYESVLCDIDATFDLLDEFLRLRGTRKLIENATKNMDSLKFADYVARYADYDPLELGRDVVAAINEYLDPDIVRRAGYSWCKV